MFLPTNLNLNNKYFFINFLRFVFSHYDYIIFFNILKYSNSHIFLIRQLKFASTLRVQLLNSKILSSFVKNVSKVTFLPGTYLIVYSNDLSEIFNFLDNSVKQYPYFSLFTLLFKKSFILLDSLTVKKFLLLRGKVDSFTLFFMLLYVYIAAISYIQVFFSTLTLGLKQSFLFVKS